jgi:hypothetical protein
MNRIPRTVVVVVALVALAALAPSVAAASSSSTSGTWDDCNFAPVVSSAGPNLVVSIGITENFQGPLNGSYVGTERDVVYANGSATFHGSGVFTGTIDGRTGTATYRYEGVAPAGAAFRANWVLIGRTGGLAAAQGQGTFTGGFDGVSDVCDGGLYSGMYEGQIRMAP